MRNERIGTSYFESDVAAIHYYGPYGFSPSEVKAKVEAGEIHIGKPTITNGQTLALDRREGRYFIETTDGCNAPAREALPTDHKPILDVSLTVRIWMPEDFGKGWDYDQTIYYGAWHAWAGSYDRSESHNHAEVALWEETKPEATQADPGGHIIYAEYDIERINMDHKIRKLQHHILAIHERYPPRDPRPLEDDEVWYSLGDTAGKSPEFMVTKQFIENGVLRTEFKDGYMLNEPYKLKRDFNNPNSQDDYFLALNRKWEDQGQYFKRGEDGKS